MLIDSGLRTQSEGNLPEAIAFRRSVAFPCVLPLVTTAFPCRGASSILLDRLGPTQASLYISNADGSEERILSQSGSVDYDPSWSPRDDWIVFTSERTGPANLYRIHPAGSSLEQRQTIQPPRVRVAKQCPLNSAIQFAGLDKEVRCASGHTL